MKWYKFISSLFAFMETSFVSKVQFQSQHKRRTNAIKITNGEGRIHGHLILKRGNTNMLDVKISGNDTYGVIFEQTLIQKAVEPLSMFTMLRMKYFTCWQAPTGSRLEMNCLLWE